MLLKINQVLALAFLFLLCFDSAEAISCLRCKDVQYDNICKEPEKICNAGLWKFCYSRMTVKNGAITRMDRGCSAGCRFLKYKDHRYQEEMLCCEKDLCNNHNLWII